MTVTVLAPMSPQRGTLQNFTPLPDHIVDADDSTFIALALEWKKRHNAGKRTQNDHHLVTSWLAQCSSTDSDETRKTYLRHIERFRRFLRQWNEQPINEQTDERFLAPGNPEAIEAFAAVLRQQVTKGEMAVSSFNVLIAAVSSFYKWCSQPTRRGFSGVPLSPVPSGLQMKKPEQKAKSLSHEQLQAVLHSARCCKKSSSGHRDGLIIRLTYLLGTRATETINLQWGDVIETDSGSAVHVRKEHAKGKKERFIPIDEVVLELLASLKAAQPQSEWMVPNLKEPWHHISRQGLWKLCSRAGKEAGVHFYPHKSRHSHATHAYAVTKDPKLIQQTLGHSDIGTTMSLYVHGNDGDSSTKHLTGMN
jgi:integrase